MKDFLMVIMASGIARGRVRTTTATATESRNMVAILQPIAEECRLFLAGFLKKKKIISTNDSGG